MSRRRPRHPWEPICDWPTGLVKPVRVDPTGRAGPTRGQAAGPRWRRTSQGFYGPATVDAELPEQRILEAAMRLPSGGAVTGWAAARAHGANLLDGLLADRRTKIPVPLAVGPRHNPRPDPAVGISRERLDADEIVRIHGIPCTRPRRALFDEMRRVRDWREAVVAIDMMAAAQLVSISQMEEYAEDHRSWRRASQVFRALGHASEHSRSPNETRMRLVWEVDAGFPRPLVNVPVFTLRGVLLGYADLFDPVAGVVGEFDGADHRGAVRQSKDADRESRFRDRGLEYFKVTGLDLRDPAVVVDRMTSTRRRAKWLPASRRTWTLEPPPGWQHEESLDELLGRRAWMEQVAREGDPDIREIIGL